MGSLCSQGPHRFRMRRHGAGGGGPSLGAGLGHLRGERKRRDPAFCIINIRQCGSHGSHSWTHIRLETPVAETLGLILNLYLKNKQTPCVLASWEGTEIPPKGARTGPGSSRGRERGRQRERTAGHPDSAWISRPHPHGSLACGTWRLPTSLAWLASD